MWSDYLRRGRHGGLCTFGASSLRVGDGNWEGPALSGPRRISGTWWTMYSVATLLGGRLVDADDTEACAPSVRRPSRVAGTGSVRSAPE